MSVAGDPFRDMEGGMHHLPALKNVNGIQKAFMPALDMYEEQNTIIVETPLAGVDPKDVEISVEKGVLTIEGSHKKEHEVDEKNYYHKEGRSGSFFRKIGLPSSVMEDQVTAEIENGVVKISCPKAETKGAKKVSVKVTEKGKKQQ